jgi:Integrase core domain
VRPSHRVTGDRRDTVEGAGWEYAHVAIDDCTRLAYVGILPDDKRYTATAFWLRALREFRRRGIHVKRVLTDNGGAYAVPYANSAHWRAALTRWLHRYNEEDPMPASTDKHRSAALLSSLNNGRRNHN